MSTTSTDSPPSSDFLPPPDASPEEVLEWLEREEARVAAAITAHLLPVVQAAAREALAMVAAAKQPVQAWATWVEEDLAPHFGGVYRGGALRAVESAKRLPPVPSKVWETMADQQAIEYVLQAQSRLVGLGSEAWGATQVSVFNGLVKGEGTREVAARLKSELPDLTQHRADTIARTELVGAFNNGEHAGLSSLGEYGPTMKTWLATGGSRTRPSHRAADGQTVPFRETFSVGHYQMKHPHDPMGPAEEVVNCRCTTLHYYPGDTLPDGTTAGEAEALTPRMDPASGSTYRQAKPLSVHEAGEGFDVDTMMRSGDPKGDLALRHLYDKQGFNAKPRVVSDAELDELLRDGEHQTLYRGVQRHPMAPRPGDVGSGMHSYADEFRYDDHFAGWGIYGNGTYTAYGQNALDTATSYAGRQGEVLRMAVNPSKMRIISEADAQDLVYKLRGEVEQASAPLKRKMREFEDQPRWEGLGWRPYADDPEFQALEQEYMAVARLENLYADPGRAAASQGYDAIKVNQSGPGWKDGYLVILNRSAVTVSDTNFVR